MRPQSDVPLRSLRFNLSLPLFFTQKNKLGMGTLMLGFAIAVYLPTNHFHFYSPEVLPLSWLDLMIPFMPNTVWIYLSEYAFFVIVYLTCKSLTHLNKYFYSFIALQIVSAFIFVAYPTTYPRELYPLPADLDLLTYSVFLKLRETDTPANCCPSLHVSSVYLSAFLFLNDRKRMFLLFFTWGTAIAISTLTTKQHYCIDVITGLMMAVFAYWIFHRMMNYHNLGGERKALTVF